MAGLRKSQGFYGMDRRAPLADSAARAFIAVASALCLAAWALDAGFARGGMMAFKAIAAFALGVLLVLPWLADHAPHGRFGAANTVTLARAAMAALLIGLVGEGDSALLAIAALAIAIPALALDGVDGWLARRSRMESAFGARFDMETDAVLMLVLCALAWQLGKAGPWILAAGLMRYAFIAAAGALPWLRRPLPPSQRRKTVCVVQIIALLVMIAPFVPAAASAVLGAASLGVLAWSFAVDTRWLAREAS
jgi:phosphatidylglycerophosphate synthase